MAAFPWSKIDCCVLIMFCECYLYNLQSVHWFPMIIRPVFSEHYTFPCRISVEGKNMWNSVPMFIFKER